jgi:hypothetical protein
MPRSIMYPGQNHYAICDLISSLILSAIAHRHSGKCHTLPLRTLIYKDRIVFDVFRWVFVFLFLAIHQKNLGRILPTLIARIIPQHRL